MAVLIYFLHHAATSIQAGHVLGVAGRRLDEDDENAARAELDRAARRVRRLPGEDETLVVTPGATGSGLD